MTPATLLRWHRELVANKWLRDALCDFAADTRHVKPWAADLYDQARARGPTTPTPSGSWPAPGPA